MFSQKNQLFDSLKFNRSQLILPSSLIISGSLLTSNHPNSIKNNIRDYRNTKIGNFKTSFDDYLEFTPLFLCYAFELGTKKGSNDLLQKTIIIAKTQILANALTQGLKYTTYNLRPDGSTYNSFPSGHTVQAFSMATILSKEYGKQYQWIPYVSYTIAGSVGVLRMMNNRHYISDVLTGAGIGILSAKIIYWSHQYKFKHKK